jgi:hypothetical protein
VAAEVNRKTSTRRIKNPDGDGNDSDSDVIVQVIDELTFVDPSKQYQEARWILDNSDQASRKVHTVTVKGKDDPSSKVEVERIDEYTVILPQTQYWETQITLDNASEDRFDPDYTPAETDKRVTHDVKVYSKDRSSWLKIRRTDSFVIRSERDEQFWETKFILDNKDPDVGDPTPELDAPTKDWDHTSINPPWRLDPFQNIVDLSWGGKLFVVLYNGNRVAAWPMPRLDDLVHFGDPVVNRSLPQSNWAYVNNFGNSDHTLISTQMKINADVHPIMASFSLIDTTGPDSEPRLKIAHSDRYSLFLTDYFAKNKGTLLTAGHLSNTARPIINGSGTTVYAAGGDTLTVNLIRDDPTDTTKITNKTLTLTPGAGYPYAPSVVTPSGQSYYSVQASSLITMQDTDATPGYSGYDFSPTVTQTPDPLPFPVEGTLETTTRTPIDFCSVAGPGLDEMSVAKSGTKTDVILLSAPDPFTQDSTWSESLSAPYMDYRKNGKIDSVNLRWAAIAANGAQHIAGDNSGTTGSSLSGNASWLGVSVPYAVFPDDQLARFYPWPYWVGGAPNYVILTETALTLTTTYGQSVVLSDLAENGFRGNFHASNGKHIVQSFDANSTRYIMLDGTDFGATIAGKLGIDPSAIDCILLDMKSGDIAKLI